MKRLTPSDSILIITLIGIAIMAILTISTVPGSVPTDPTPDFEQSLEQLKADPDAAKYTDHTPDPFKEAKP